MSTFKASIKLLEAVQEDYTTLKQALHQQAFKISSNAVADTEVISVKQGDIHEVTCSLIKAVRVTGRKFSFTVIKHKS